MVIGLTGGIGCGKSAAAACFSARGFVHVDADALARQALVRPDVVAALTARWGVGILDGRGLPDRAGIAAKVFSDRAELAYLESVVHPVVAQLRHAAVADPARSYIAEIPLLFEKGLQSEFSCVVCVTCSESVRLARLEARGLPRAEAMRRIGMQMAVSQKVELSDHVLWNDGDLEFLQSQVDRLLADIGA